MEKNRRIVEAARSAALTAKTRSELSDAIFGPNAGLVARAYPTPGERDLFATTPEYRALCDMIEATEEWTDTE